LTDLSSYTSPSAVGPPRQARAPQRRFSWTVLLALVAACCALLAPDAAGAAPGLISERPPVDARISLASGSGAAPPVVAAPAIGFESRSLPFGRLDVALLVLGSVALACLASGALRLLSYRPLPVLVEAISAPTLPVGIAGDTLPPRWAQGTGPG
jgi:hypothetical protein